ncbi:MAG: PIG-L deacetylase family protein [Gaiellaceae bacterium]
MLVVSPHLDDAILSLGATMTHVARSGASVAVLTVFAGNPESTRPASGWDRRAGFETEGEAATARRSEDLEACRVVGAAPTWLPFAPGSYGDRRDPDEVWSALTPAVTRADTVYVPGFPLTNEDHAWLAALFVGRDLSVDLVRYSEQPYRYGVREEGRSPGRDWERSRVAIADYRRKRRAVQAYRSQLPLLGLTRNLNRLLLHEFMHGGEALLRSRSAAA